MLSPTKLDKLVNDLCHHFSNHPFSETTREQIKQLLETGLAKLDLVTRTEFDAQVKVLQRTREKLAALEAQLNAANFPKD